jgi:hypothetical protein
MAQPPPRPRVSHERLALETLRAAIAGLAHADAFSGQGGGNRFGIDGWELALLQQFQFGDLRVETPAATIVVEVESGGGVGNLVKYWPLLADKPLPKRLAILHVFQLHSEADYIAHRRLWQFLVERMRADLEPRGVRWGAAWEAQIFSYRAGEPPTEAAAALRAVAESAT